MQITHAVCVRGMQIKSEEAHFELGEGHPNELQHHTHDGMHVGMCWMCVAACCCVGCSTVCG